MVIDNSYGTIDREINLTSKDVTNSIGMVVRNNEIEEVTTINGNISVEGAGTVSSSEVNGETIYEMKENGNVGLGVKNADVVTNGAISVGQNSGQSGSFYPIGVYLTSDKPVEFKDDKYVGYSYTGGNGAEKDGGELKVGEHATGIFGKNYNITYNDNISVAGSAIGILGEGTADNPINITVNGNISTSSEETSADKAVGIYGKDANITVVSDASQIGTGTNTAGDIGILSVGQGDISYTGDMTIAGTEVRENSTIGIYKEKGSGDITVGTGDWTIGEGSFGIVIRNGKGPENGTGEYYNERINISNSANLTLNKGSVGIYSYEINDVINEKGAAITVGESEVKSDSGENEVGRSIGIYMINDRTGLNDNKWSVGTNNGIINVEHENSIGVWAAGYVNFTNNGEINVSNGATGLYAANGAIVTNSKDGVINISENTAGITNNTSSIGMRADDAGTKIINEGQINVNAEDAFGMYIGNGATLDNREGATITVNNGYGIGGDLEGNIINRGNIIVNSPGQEEKPNEPEENVPDVPETNLIGIFDDVVKVGAGYTSIGGILETDLDLELNNTLIDVTAGDKLGFVAPDISGEVRIVSNFALTGNGYSYEFKDYLPENAEDLTFNISPLFTPTVNGDDLAIAKVDYKEIAKYMGDAESNKFYDGLDELLKNGVDDEVLQKLNAYLSGFGNDTKFYNEFQQATSQLKGNIYANVQSRMQDINRSFENSFNEMEQSYNLSKDTDKFSVIYTNGDYRNSKAGIPEYDYNIAGLMYMKEYEGLEPGNKHGYSLGFTGSKFEFEDIGGSEEKVYSLRAGAHNVKDFGEGLDLLTKADVGFNYHETDRKVVLGAQSFENDADFNSYYVSLENKFRKTLYQDYENEFGTYAGLDLEYGRFDDIKEDGEIEVKVKANDYFISKLKAGFNGTGRKYVGNDWTMKLTGDVGYSYDFGKNYGENEAKLRGSSQGYYSLMSEVESRGAVSGTIGVGFERLNHLGVTLEGEVAKDFERDEEYWKVGLRFNYKFNKEDAVTTLRNTFNLLGNHFAFDKDEVDSRDKKIVAEGSRLIDKHNIKGTIVIEGHTDNRGTEKYNQELSERRAANTEKEFKNNIQKAENINYNTKGYGETKPIESNDTPEGRAANRRTNVKFIDKR